MKAGFERARLGFLRYAARALGLSAPKVLVSPIEEDAVVQLDQKIGRAWAFYGTSKRTPSESVRGWAVANGRVITPKKNLGLLFVEAGVWDARSPAVDGGTVAANLVWAMGEGHRLVSGGTMKVDGHGSGALEYEVAYRERGPGGAGGGPEKRWRCTVRLSADHRARLTRVAVAPPSASPFD